MGRRSTLAVHHRVDPAPFNLLRRIGFAEAGWDSNVGQSYETFIVGNVFSEIKYGYKKAINEIEKINQNPQVLPRGLPRLVRSGDSPAQAGPPA